MGAEELYQESIEAHEFISEDRISLTQLKTEIQRENYEEALDRAAGAFGEESVLTIAVRLLTGVAAGESEFQMLAGHDIVPRSQEAAWGIHAAVHIATSNPTPHSKAWDSQVKAALLDL